MKQNNFIEDELNGLMAFIIVVITVALVSISVVDIIKYIISPL